MLRAILLCFAYMRSSNERCDKLSAAYLAYERDQPCPSSQDATSDDPLSALAFAPECSGLAPPPRACVAPTPAAAVEPAEARMWKPSIENIAAARFPKYDLGGGSWRGGSKKRGHTDCAWCFDFKGSKTTDEAYVKKMAKTIPLSTPAIRTAVDMGAGSGGVLAVLQAAPYNVIGVGLTMSMDNAPHLEVMGARGLIGLRWSLAKALPFADGAFDLLHARLSGLGSAGAQAASRRERLNMIASVLYEWDRVVRPGGYLVQTDWRVSSPVTMTADIGFAKAAAEATKAKFGARAVDEGGLLARADLPLRTERKTSQRLAREAGAQNGAEAEAWAREYLGFIQVTIDHVRAVARRLKWEELAWRPGFRFESVSFTFRKPLNRTALGEPPTSVDALLGGPGETVFKFK